MLVFRDEFTGPREVNAFKFPEERRDSNSPELGFRDEVFQFIRIPYQNCVQFLLCLINVVHSFCQDLL